MISCHDSLAQHVFDSAYRGILMATSDEGRLNVGMWQYNKQWVRDSCQTALGALHVGLHEEAGLALRKVLTDLVDDEGRTIIADAFVDERHEQFDQAGQLLFALSQYVLWTGDTSIVTRPLVQDQRGCRPPVQLAVPTIPSRASFTMKESFGSGATSMALKRVSSSPTSCGRCWASRRRPSFNAPCRPMM